MENHHGYHDIGGELSGGPINRSEHDYALWEKRVDALLMLLSNRESKLVRVDELRRGIESIGPEAYKMSYYERWITSISNTLLERGVFTSQELSQKMAEVELNQKTI